MTTRNIVISLLATLALGAQLQAAMQEHAPALTTRSGFIVQAHSAEAAAGAVSAVGAQVYNPLPLIDAVSTELDDSQQARLAATPGIRLYRDRTVNTEASSQTFKSGTSVSTNLNQFSTNYPMLVGADQLQSAGITGKGVTVAFIDSGLWKNNINDHYGKRLLARLDFVGSANAVAYTGDDNGHGTHVTSIAASADTNNVGQYYGVAPGASVIAARAFQKDGSASYADVIKALSWIVANKSTYKIRVLNLSFGAPPQSYYWDDPLNQAVMKAWQAGIVVVTSAGNEGPAPMTIGVPGNVPYVITAGALTDNYTPYDGTDDRLASFSSTGPTYEGFVKPEVVAPGGHMVATMSPKAYLVQLFGANMKQNDTLFTMSGTSQAAAVTTGVVALMLQSDPTLTPDQVKCRLMSASRPAVTDTGVLAYSVFQQGAGLINAISAISSAASGCANTGLDVAADLAGSAHFGGPANQDASGNYYVMDMQGASWGQPLAADGYAWNRAYTWSKGYVWSQAYTWSKAYTWAKAYTWSRSTVWDKAYTWSKGYAWSNSLAWQDGGFTTQGLTQPMSVDPYVSDE